MNVEPLIYVGSSVILTVPLLLLGLAVPYVVLRMRDAQNPTPDPQVGMRAALYYFYSVALLLILLGLTVAVVDYLQRIDDPPRTIPVPPTPRVRPGQRPLPAPATPAPPDFFESFNEEQRYAGALMLSGALFLLLHFLLLRILVDTQRSTAARRVFLGGRFAVHGMVVMVVLTMLLVTVFQKKTSFRPDEKPLRAMIGILIVWVPSWMVHMLLLRSLISPPANYPLPRRPVRNPQGGEAGAAPSPEPVPPPLEPLPRPPPPPQPLDPRDPHDPQDEGERA